MRTSTALAALLLLAACTPQIQSPPATLPAPAHGGIIEERVTQVAGVSGFDGPWIEFANRDHGYAMFTMCTADACTARLFSTVDGAKSWKGREHPQPVAKNQQMYVTGPETVVLLSEPDAWYITRDGAASWQRVAYTQGVQPPEYPAGDGGRFYLEDSGAIRDLRDPKAHLPAPEGATWLTNSPTGDLWLTGEKGGAPLTWFAEREPNTWRPVPVPQQAGRPVFSARVTTSADGKDTWLIADQEPAPAGSGGTARARGLALKATGLPLIWRFVNLTWVPVPTSGIDERPHWSYSAASAGDGMIVVSGPEGLTYLRDRVVHSAPNPVLGWVGRLRDGTLFGQATHNEAVYLSSGTGSARDWIKVVLAN
ncbi:MAG TPA: hypothetical protein VF062_11380 [Candidatus Limnocylindrales bacterium]